MSVALLCELGRENVRFGIIDPEAVDPPSRIAVLQVADFTTFTDAIIHYLKTAGIDGKVAHFALAVAGVVRGNTVGATNGRWLLSIPGLTAFLAVKPLILNDFAASAYALKSLPETSFIPAGPIGAARPAAAVSYTLIGPLDGLGVAGLLADGSKNFVIQSEAGHASMSSADNDAQTFSNNLRKKYRMAYVEHLLSEDGLRRAYSFFSDGGSVEIAPIATAAIIAKKSFDPAAKAAVRMFTDQLAAFSRDIVITFGTWEGLYFSGKLANALVGELSETSFRAQFAENHSYSKLLRGVPMAVVTEHQTALAGLAVAVRARKVG